MAYDQELAHRIAEALKGEKGITEKKMFGGIAWMVDGHMAIGIVKDQLMLRVPKDQYDSYLAEECVKKWILLEKP